MIHPRAGPPRAAVLAEGDSLTRTDLTYLAPLPVFNADGTVKE